VQDHQVPVGGQARILARCVVPTPANARGKTFPLLVWYHAGGFISGYAAMDDYILRHICVELQISIVNVDYRLAPEFPFPTGINDSYAALKWAVQNVALLSANLSKGFIVSGLSAGGTIAAVMALRARDDPFFRSYPLTGQILHSPATIHPAAYPDRQAKIAIFYSSLSFTHAPILPGRALAWFYGLVKAPPADPDFSPLLASEHAGLPPLWMQLAGMDPLRDEALLYEKVLRTSGVQTKLHVYPGVPHAFEFVFPKLSISIQFRSDFRDGIKWLLALSA
ncbi:Esterase/lipase/thioesterase, partial [Heterobasidion irregulare TC 32-1]